MSLYRITDSHRKETTRVNDKLVSILQQEMKNVDIELAQLRTEEEQLKKEMATRLRALSDEASQLQVRRRHLQALLALEGVEQVAAETIQGAPGEAQAEHGEEETVTLADHVYYYLLERGKEQHYRGIAEALTARGVEITGKDPPMTLVAYIHGDERFKRPRRGVYGLAEWYPRRMRSVGSRRRKGRRKRVIKAISGSGK